jgi:hypothetical protein
LGGKYRENPGKYGKMRENDGKTLGKCGKIMGKCGKKGWNIEEIVRISWGNDEKIRGKHG